MDFKSYLQKSAEEINKELGKFCKEWSKDVEKASPRLSFLNQCFVRACSGGKRLRGTLVKLGYEIASGQSNPEILKPAVAFEIFQTAVLAHDDIIDKSDLRRGKPTLWKCLGGDHYGISQTICLGDVGFFLSYKLISESNFLEKNKNRAIAFYTNAMIQTALGEILDVEVPHSGKTDEDTYLKICQLKTAFYTLIGPLQLGAVFGGAKEALLKRLAQFGENLGIAFQIQDDILGVFGEEETLGKSVTSDIEEGKNTLLIAYALKNASLEQREVLDKYYGKGKIGQEALEEVRKVFVDTGSLDYSQKKALKLVEEAKKLIPAITLNQEKAKLLSEMADLLVQRDK